MQPVKRHLFAYRWLLANCLLTGQTDWLTDWLTDDWLVGWLIDWFYSEGFSCYGDTVFFLFFFFLSPALWISNIYGTGKKNHRGKPLGYCTCTMIATPSQGASWKSILVHPVIDWLFELLNIYFFACLYIYLCSFMFNSFFLQNSMYSNLSVDISTLWAQTSPLVRKKYIVLVIKQSTSIISWKTHSANTCYCNRVN